MKNIATNVQKKTTCTKTMKLLGDFWTLSIINTLSAGKMRYCELQRQTGKINPVTFTHRLVKLEDAGLIQRIEEKDNALAVTYSLTSLGKEALLVLNALDAFSKKIPH